MFKPGEAALTKDGRTTIVTSSLPDELKNSGHCWPVSTKDGIFDEPDLAVAHPTVLATASGRDPSAEYFEKRQKERMEEVGLKDENDLVDRYTLMAKVQKLLVKATLEWNGHWKNGSAIRKEYRSKILKTTYLGPNAMERVDAEAILKEPGKAWVPIELADFRMSMRTCSCCGSDAFNLETNGKVVRIGGPPCQFPDGLPPNEWELNVPSGRLVIANDLRELFPLEDDHFDVNTDIGCRQTASAYAAVGMSHAFVGNTCPGVYRCKDGTYKIANPPSEDRWDEKTKKYVPFKAKFEGERLAGICTDLWWYSICDEEEYKRRLKRFKRKKDRDIEVIDVEPGVYRFRHSSEDREGPKVVYTRFERVRAPDPVKDFLSSYETVDVNPHAYVQAQAARWPTLYGKVKERRGRKEEPVPWAELTEEQRLSAWQRVMDHVFNVIGGGTEWHEKGFPVGRVDPSVPDVEPPSFRAQHHWYPFSKKYSGIFEQKVLTPSFAKVAFRILESVISFGTDVHDSAHSREVAAVRERMLEAVERYRELMKQYPEQADPEYVAWLSEEGRAEAWVAKFDLGPVFTEKHRKHAASQRWVPEDAYAVEFDARKLKDGHFAWHPKVMGAWANKKDAQRYAILEWTDNERPAEHNCFWSAHAVSSSVPLYTVARVKKVGEVSHMGETLVEVAFDYGTSWMKNEKKRKALAEHKEKAALRVLTKEEYDALFPAAVKFYEDAETAAAKESKK